MTSDPQLWLHSARQCTELTVKAIKQRLVELRTAVMVESQTIDRRRQFTACGSPLARYDWIHCRIHTGQTETELQRSQQKTMIESTQSNASDKSKLKAKKNNLSNVEYLLPLACQIRRESA